MSATKLMHNVCSRVIRLQGSDRLQSVRALASSAFFAPKHQQQRTPHHSGLPDHQSRSLSAPAVAHHAFTRTPLSTPIVQPSHTTISIPLGSIDLFGNYSIQGPAVIRKVNNTLMALVQPGGVVSVLCNPEGPTHMSSASLSHDEDEAALCHLVGHHLELDGSFIMQDRHQGSMEHDGKTIVSVAHLSDDTCITLLPGGSMSHPVNVQPPKQHRH